MSRRSFLWSAAAAAAGFTGWRWLVTRRDEDGIAWPFRRALETNEQLWRDLYKPARLAPTFPRNAAKEPRPNGDVGLSEDFDPSEWKLRVEGLASGGTLELILDDVKALPKVEMVTELKCIEGWSQIVHWGGARFADFAQKFPPATGSDYVYMETPDGGYYVGLDIESVLHPQTLLCYEMNGEPLTLEHGAPLRLVIPLKYGIKNIKRIGVIRFTDKRPADYWAERSYDWYAGH
jgi:DMSO/TMAO reductase YedYZ molybdopterin-dependent catalytic subunit